MIKTLAVFAFVLMIVGCSSQPSVSYSSSPAPSLSGSSSALAEAEQEDVFDEEKVASQIKLSDYQYVDDVLGTNWVFIAAKNESNFDVQLTFDIEFRDKEETVIGVQSKTVTVLDSGHETLFKFKTDDKYDSYRYSGTLQADTLLPARLDNFTYDTNVLLDKKKVIVSVTNNTNAIEKAIEYEALFFLNGEVVDTAWGYIKDGNYEIQPKVVRSEEINSFEQFDDFKIFYYS